jgi:RHS repeat-associated protein
MQSQRLAYVVQAGRITQLGRGHTEIMAPLAQGGAIPFQASISRQFGNQTRRNEIPNGASQWKLRHRHAAVFSTHFQNTFAPIIRRWLLIFAFVCGESLAWAQNAPISSRFSAQPTEEEISRARVFDEPLLAIGQKPTPEEDEALADALSAYAARTNFDDLFSFENFLNRYPNGAWSGSLLLHLGTEYYNYGYYSKALDSWEQAWQDLKDTDDPKGKAQADRALGELARMYSKLGRMNELSDLLASVANRSLTGPGVQLIHSAHEGLWLMQHRPGICFRCGPMALDSIISDEDPAKASNLLILQCQSTTNGFSLSQVAHLSKQLGMNYQMAYRSPGSPWVVPAVIHWKVGHYAALLRQNGNRFLVKDHTFQSSLWVSASALENESSGYFLIPPGPFPAGWRAVSQAESQSVWGRGQTSGQNGNYTGPGNTQSGGSPGAGSGSPGDPGSTGGGGSSGGSGGGSGGSCGGMTTYTFDTMLASLSLNDTPLGYKPPIGPWVRFTATYDQDEANQPATFSYANLGPQWTCNWISYITDDPDSPGENVSCYQPGGGTLTFTGFNSANGTFAPETLTQGILTQTSSSSYQMQFQSGVSWIFALSNGSKGSSRQIFLTQFIDAAGNSVTLDYDSSLRVTNITDAIGQSTIFFYTNAAYPYAITAVQDPFGRTAYFQYNGSGLLSQITDVLGITSQYAYGANDFITNLTTPYGTTTFSSGTTNGGPWVEATDPLGESEMAEAPQNGIVSTGSDPAATVPTNMPVALINDYLNFRDTYFWDKQAFPTGAGDPSQAVVYHFLHTTDINIESGVLESIKRPLENRVWNEYANEAQSIQLGPETVNRPIAVGRVLDDGASQTYYYQYNALGNLTNSTDPLGRSFTYVYSTNNVDLLQVQMTSNGRNELQSSITYNSQHRPLTMTDASGQTTTNTYNSRGQILSTTDPLGEITTYAYDTNGYMLSVTGALQNASDVNGFTYDGFGRVRTSTDTEGYTLTYAYDAMDRLTNITYPDGTFSQFVYTLLDLTASRDRLGRWTTNSYNADRQLVQAEDPLGRITQYQYCDCGALEALFDPAGNVTWWDHDIQSRVTGKYYADGSGITYTYENTTSRLHSRMDEKDQETVYQYYNDNNPKSVSYPNAIVATPTVTYTYDTNYDRIVEMQDGFGTTLYTYNPITPTPVLGAGLLVSVSGPLPNSLVTYQYDQLERVTNRAINGVAQATTFDVLGRPTTVTNALGAFQYTYVGATPRLASESYPNGQTNLYSYYDNIGDDRLLQIQNLYPNGSLLSGFGYAYNSVGDITAWSNQWDTLPTRVWFPSYDAADQLTNVVVAGGNSPVTNYAYAYDPSGNRVLVATNSIQTQFSYNALNQIVGSSITLPDVIYRWDAENRLAAINSGANSSEFSYDGLGQRVEDVEETNDAAVSTNYFLWCNNDICQERDSTGSNVLRRLYPQGEVVIAGGNKTNYFYTQDHLGSIREATDSAGSLVTRYDYDPFGRQITILENFQPTFSYAGDFLHRPSGLNLTLFRAYSSIAGRWLSRDPIAEKGGVNLYAYVANDPVGLIDQLGLDEYEVTGGGGTTVSGFPPPSVPPIQIQLPTLNPPNYSPGGPPPSSPQPSEPPGFVPPIISGGNGTVSGPPPLLPTTIGPAPSPAPSSSTGSGSPSEGQSHAPENRGSGQGLGGEESAPSCGNGRPIETEDVE